MTLSCGGMDKGDLVSRPPDCKADAWNTDPVPLHGKAQGPELWRPLCSPGKAPAVDGPGLRRIQSVMLQEPPLLFIWVCCQVLLRCRILHWIPVIIQFRIFLCRPIIQSPGIHFPAGFREPAEPVSLHSPKLPSVQYDLRLEARFQRTFLLDPLLLLLRQPVLLQIPVPF